MLAAAAKLLTVEVSFQPVDCIDPTVFHKKASAMEMEIEELQRQGAGGRSQVTDW